MVCWWRMWWLCLLTLVSVSATEYPIESCDHEVQALLRNAVSQDVLYNTALGKCQKGVHDWNYDSAYSNAPVLLASRYDIPSDARLHCARAQMMCDTVIDGPLGIIMPTAHTKTVHDVCVRGAHVYGLWTLSIPSVFSELHLTHDMHVERTKTVVSSSAVEGNINWPFSLFEQQIKKIVLDASLDASTFYLQRLCAAY